MMLKLRYTSFIILYINLFYFSLQGQRIIRIPEDYPTIQQGLDAAQTNTTILVSPGIYFENIIWPAKIDSIKLIGIEGSSKTIIDGNNKGRVITLMGGILGLDIQIITKETLIQGFTIQRGRTTNLDGAGLYCLFASPSLYDLRIIQNECLGNNCSGGGAQLYYFTGIIDNCHFIDNKIETNEFSYGAGLSTNTTNLIIRNCTFENNLAINNHYSTGGGLYARLYSINSLDSPSLTIINCKFSENKTQADSWSPGGGIYIYNSNSGNSSFVYIDSCLFYKNESKYSQYSDGGALSLDVPNIIVKNSHFIENKAQNGAGVYFNIGQAQLHYAKFENTIFTRNQSNDGNLTEGSAIFTLFTPIELSLINVTMNNNQSSAISINNNQSVTEMTHCTNYNNDLHNNYRGSKLIAQNSVFWNKNTKEFDQSETGINLNHCIVRGGYPGLGNLDKDPLLLNANLPIPKINSPCLNGGLLNPLINKDINGFPRPMPINSLPDIGAYEMDQYFAHVLAKYYYDINQNGIRDINERFLSFGSVKDHNGQTHVNYSENGSYIILQQGMASIQYVENASSDWKSNGQTFYQFNVNSAQFSETVEIGLYPQTTQSKLSTMVYGNNFRCGEEVRFTITLTNNGTTIESGFFWLKMDDRLDSIWFTDLPDDIISKHEFSWRYQDLYPGESITKEFFVLAPRITNPNELGEIYKFCHGVSGLSLRDDNCYLAELRCSFDPNDKFSIPQREDQLSLKGEPMIYTIRFQNTGNDYARNVIIRDNIDRSFNLNSLKILQTSHPDILEVSYDDARELIFSFKDIFLPDSTTDYEGSNGYVIYSLEYNDGLPENTVVNNTANIFFDFNPAIVTNTTHNIVVTEYPTNTSNPNGNRIFVYPNPATNYLKFSQKVDRSILFNLQGQIINQSSNINNLIIHSVPGTYILRLESEGNFYYHKVLVIGN